MKRYSPFRGVMLERQCGTWVKFDDLKTPLDKPAALMALIDYCELTGNGRADAAIEKLAAAIIAEVEQSE